MADYSTIISNLNNFYTDGSSAIDYLNSQQLTLQELGEIIDASDRFTATRNASGEIIQFSQKVSTQTASSGVSSAINSNISNVSKTTVNIPINSAVDGTGKVTLSQGLGSATKFLTGSVLPAIGAVATGISLGKTIDSALYNANPDFWDSHGMSTLNPETWSSITNGDNTGLNGLFNAVFGIDPDTGETQMYLDENVLAYMTAYMGSQGVFGSGESEDVIVTPNQDAGRGVETGTINARKTNFTESWIASYPNLLTTPQDAFSDGILNWFFSCFDDSLPAGGVSITNVNFENFIIASSSQLYRKRLGVQGFKLGETMQWQGSTSGIGDQVYNYTYDNRRVYYVVRRVYDGDMPTIPVSNPIRSFNSTAWLSVYGAASQSSGGVEGITDQEGAVVPDLSGIQEWTDIDSVLEALRTAMPDLFNNSITQDLFDPNGLQQKVYVPVGMPSYDLGTMNQPLGDLATQQNPALNPELAPEGFPDLFTDTVIDPQYDPLIVPPEPLPVDPNPDDSGGGGIVPTPTPPEGSASALFTAYRPTQTQVDEFGAWLWSNNFGEQLKKIFNDPMESIISLHKVFGAPTVGTTDTIHVGYLDSGVSSSVIADQYTTIDCGTLTLSEYFGNVFDYNNTSIELYLPFIGIVPLSTADVMRGTINVTYHVDVLTGACLADVSIVRDLAGGVLYEYSGNCAVHYPLSMGSYMGIVSGLLGAVGAVAGTVASGGSLAPLALGVGAGALMGSHTDVSRSGGFSANAGAMGIKKPYLIISRPQTAMASNYEYLEGAGSNVSTTLGACSGYVKIKSVHVKNIPAFDNELDEIETLLKGGVIV